MPRHEVHIGIGMHTPEGCIDLIIYRPEGLCEWRRSFGEGCGSAVATHRCDL